MFFLLTDINRAVELLDKLQRTGEVPPQKLQALQRVLQSEFCNAVREVRHFVFFIKRFNCEMVLVIKLRFLTDWCGYFVFTFWKCEELDLACDKILPTMSPQVYEHVYETVDINSSPEVRANATAKVENSHTLYNTQASD